MGKNRQVGSAYVLGALRLAVEIKRKSRVGHGKDAAQIVSVPLAEMGEQTQSLAFKWVPRSLGPYR